MKVVDLKFDLRQLCYLEVVVEADLKKCKHCNVSSCGLTKGQCDSYKRVKREVLDILKNA